MFFTNLAKNSGTHVGRLVCRGIHLKMGYVLSIGETEGNIMQAQLQRCTTAHPEPPQSSHHHLRHQASLAGPFLPSVFLPLRHGINALNLKVNLAHKLA